MIWLDTFAKENLTRSKVRYYAGKELFFRIEIDHADKSKSPNKNSEHVDHEWNLIFRSIRSSPCT